jgi:carboxypeptidase C (cathepsin A)
MLRSLLALLVLLPFAAAQTPPAQPAGKDKPPLNDEKPIVRKHSITIGGRTLDYTTTAGLMPIRNEDGAVEAQIFYMAYTLDGAADPSKRRLMFSFNGGPGSSSVWLHLGALGPKRVPMKDDGSFPPPPFRLEENDSTWLDLTDLVFIDPVGTGFSRAAKPELQKKFSSREGDVESVGEFIRLYLTRNNRWTSPLFLVGESYGTTRAAGLAGYLIDRGIAFNGIALVSTILNFQTARPAPGNDLPYPLMLPTFTATAWYHKRLAPDLQKNLASALRESESFAMGAYASALAKGDALPEAERRSAIEKLARLTGLDKPFLQRANLRVPLQQFNRELLRDRNLLVGRLDSRLTGAARMDADSGMEYDPSMSAIRPPYTAAFHQYVRSELGYETDANYFILGGGVGRWDMNAQNEYADVSEALRRAITRNPYMKVYVGAGYYDMATPYFAARYTLDHLGLPDGLRANLHWHEYPAGHMYYIHADSLKTLKTDIARFLDAASQVRQTRP